MSRTVIALMAIGAVVIAAAVGIAWRVKMSDRAALAAASPTAPASAPAAPAAAPPKPAETKPAPPPVAAAESKPAPTEAVMAPSFDV
ncbi:MAG: hypothetical protein ACM3II_16100, partial [Rhodospirillaceae bacterium]